MGGGRVLAAARLPVLPRRDPPARGSGIPRAPPRPGGAGRADRGADLCHRHPRVRPGGRARRRPGRGPLRRAHLLRWRAAGAVPGDLPPDGDPLLRGAGAGGARRARLARHGAPGRLDGGRERAGPRPPSDPGDRGPPAGRLAPPGGGRRDRAGDAQELDRGRGARPHLVEYRDQSLPRQQSPVRRDGGDAPRPRLAGARPGAAAPRRVGRGPGVPLLRGARHGVCRARARRVPPPPDPEAPVAPRRRRDPPEPGALPGSRLVPRSPGAALEGAGARVPVRRAPPARRRRSRRGLAAGAGSRRLGRPARARRRRVLRHGTLPRAPGPAARAVRGGGRPVGGHRGERAGARGGGRRRGGRLSSREPRPGADAASG